MCYKAVRVCSMDCIKTLINLWRNHFVLKKDILCFIEKLLINCMTDLDI